MRFFAGLFSTYTEFNTFAVALNRYSKKTTHLCAE